MGTALYAQVDVYSHHVAFSRLLPNCSKALLEFCRDLMQFDVGYDHRTQSYYKIPKRVYASSTADRSEYRFHRHQYREIIEFLARRGIFEEQFDTKVHTPCVGHPVSTFKMPD